MENNTLIVDEKPSLTVVITQNGLSQEFTLDEDIFNSFDEACEALKKFIQSYRS